MTAVSAPAFAATFITTGVCNILKLPVTVKDSVTIPPKENWANRLAGSWSDGFFVFYDLLKIPLENGKKVSFFLLFPIF